MSIVIRPGDNSNGFFLHDCYFVNCYFFCMIAILFYTNSGPGKLAHRENKSNKGVKSLLLLHRLNCRARCPVTTADYYCFMHISEGSVSG